MKPLEICEENANEIVPDSKRRVLESEARKWAAAGIRMRTRWRSPKTYWDEVVIEHEKIVWKSAYRKRLERIKRLEARQA